jgi:menaquinone-9 beta-reductase
MEEEVACGRERERRQRASIKAQQQRGFFRPFLLARKPGQGKAHAIIERMKDGYEAIIVGAGPAGSSAACYLSGMGHKVLLLDKEIFPREKVCGDGIAPRSVHALSRLGVEEEIEAKFLKTRGIRFYASRGGLTEVDYPMGSRFPDHGYVVPRIELDEILLRKAEAMGAEVRLGWEVRDVLPEEGGGYPGVEAAHEKEIITIHGRYIIGADGPLSRTASRLDMLHKDPAFIGVSVRCYMSGVEGLAERLEIYPEDAISPSCGWIFPMRDGLANVGVGAMLYAIRRKDINLNQVFEDFIHKTRHASQKLRGARREGRLRGAVLRVGLGGSRARKANVILAGDAASLTNPVSGEGITYALESGRLAAETVAAALKTGSDGALDDYQELLNAHYEHYFRMGSLAIRYGNNPWLINPLLFSTSRVRRLGDKMGRFLMNCRRSDYPL